MGRKLHYRSGSFYRIDDRTGFAERAEATREEWTGLIVAERVWEARQPQDLVKGVPDDQSVPDARPLGPNVFVGPTYLQLTSPAGIGATVLAVNTTLGASNGLAVEVMLDTGQPFRTTLSGNPGASSITLAHGLPTPAASGNLVTLNNPNPGVGG